MKATGIVRNIDELGRIVIPKELRKTYGLPEDTPIEIFVDNDSIILKKYVPEVHCTFCTEDDPTKLVKFKGKIMCKKCLEEIKRC